jgi:enoyl-CoA hydratase
MSSSDPSEWNHVSVDRDESDDRICWIRLDDPENNNALSLELILEIGEAVLYADRQDEVDAIILGSTTQRFCSGGDVKELKGIAIEDGNRFLTAYMETVEMLRESGKPTLAAVTGDCVAGGNELVMGCDLVVAGNSAKFGQPEVIVGSTAAAGGVQILPLIVGQRRAKELLLTGRLLSAEEALNFGLINRVVNDGDVEEETAALALEIIDNTSPQAYRVIKAVMKQWSNFAMIGQEVAREVTAAVWHADEFDERAEEFLSKEPLSPRNFSGTLPQERSGEDSS